MKALILNAAGAHREMAAAVEAALGPPLAAGGYEVERCDLTTLTIPDCNGDFGCWTVTPGICVQPGPHRDIARDIVHSDLLVWLTPVTFGGYASALKRQLDHCIPLISPRFVRVGGETHHEPRYPGFPSVLAIGLAEGPDPAAAQVFERLVRRNVLNMHAPHFASPILVRSDIPQLAGRVAGWLEDLAGSSPPSPEALPLALDARADLPAVPPRQALLLIGSPRGSEAVSATIAAHLGMLLEQRGMTVTRERLHHRKDPGLRDLGAAFEQAEVVTLASPLYVDSLPAPVTEALELLAEQRRASAGSRPRFLAVVNCGFPEAVHADTALAICRLFAEQASLDWIGGLAIGGGGMLGGRPLAEPGGRARAVTRALALTAQAIAEGRVVPAEAQRLTRTLAIPPWLYRLFANWSFRRQARRHGALARLGARPYAS